MRKYALAIGVIVSLLTAPQAASGHLPYKIKRDSLQSLERSQHRNLLHVQYVCKHGEGYPKRWSCRASKVWLLREWKETKAKLYVGTLQYWIDKQISAATVIGRESSGDPWPNCPDPFDGSGSWYSTVQCENGGNWYDSPGYYRCGLQFDPGWERRFGRLCP